MFSQTGMKIGPHILSIRFNQLKIILICLVPHTTHVAQPLDVSVFSPLIGRWVQRVDALPSDYNITPSNFASLFVPFLIDTLSTDKFKENIRLGFYHTGLYPFGPENVNFNRLQISKTRNKCIHLHEGVNSKGKTERGTQFEDIFKLEYGTQTTKTCH